MSQAAYATGSLELLLERAQAERDQLALTLGNSQRHLERLNDQVGQFQQYRAEYVQRWQGHFSERGGMEIVRCYQDFMGRLDQAVQQIQQQRQQAEATVAHNQSVLVEAERRISALNKLIERRRSEIAQAQWRREQKQADEMAQNLRWRQGPGLALGTLR